MDTDILAGVGSEINTILLLSGVTATPEDTRLFGFGPDLIMPTIGHLAELSQFVLGLSNGHKIRHRAGST